MLERYLYVPLVAARRAKLYRHHRKLSPYFASRTLRLCHQQSLFSAADKAQVMHAYHDRADETEAHRSRTKEAAQNGLQQGGRERDPRSIRGEGM